MAVSQNDEKTTEPPSSTLNSDSFKPNGEHVNQSNEISTNGDIGKSNELSANGDSEDKTSTNAEDQAVPSFTLKPIEIEEIFKADYLQQLSTSALPRYIPGSPPRFIKTDIKAFDIHCCAACGDTFALKASLNFHLDRRSVLIKFPCEACKSTRIFYNRCNLLSHVRAHTDKNEKAEIEKAALSVLPRVFMDGIHNEFVSTLDDELTTMDDTDDPRPGEMVECSLRELDETELDKENDENEEKDISFAKVKCLDCNEEFDSPKARREHLTNGDKIPVIVSQCNKCGLLCPSKCSLKAHQRIHLQISPYVCPECGESPDPVWANFLHHVHYACFHNSRGVGYKCPICKRFTPSNDLLLKHMELHTEKYAKCSECPRAYNSADAFKQHNNMFHEGGQVRYTMIYKCSLCDIVFVSSDQMLTHRSAHLKDQVCEYVFNCMQCGKPLESKSQLLDHLKSHHPKIYNQHIQTGPIPTKSVAASNQYRGTVECIICSATFYSQQGYNVHLYRAHINVNKPCCYCSEVMCNRQKMVAHGKAHLEDKAVVCLLCNNMRFSSLKELDAHLDNHVRKLKFCSFCPICDKLFLNLNASLNHLRVEHYLPVKKIPQSEETENNLASSHSKVNICHLCRKSFGRLIDYFTFISCCLKKNFFTPSYCSLNSHCVA